VVAALFLLLVGGLDREAIGFAGVMGYPPGALLGPPSVPLIYISIRVLFVGFKGGYIRLTTSRSICVCSIRLPAGTVATVGTGIMLQVHRCLYWDPGLSLMWYQVRGGVSGLVSLDWTGRPIWCLARTIFPSWNLRCCFCSLA